MDDNELNDIDEVFRRLKRTDFHSMRRIIMENGIHIFGVSDQNTCEMSSIPLFGRLCIENSWDPNDLLYEYDKLFGFKV